jgi:hypothetical protein
VRRIGPLREGTLLGQERTQPRALRREQDEQLSFQGAVARRLAAEVVEVEDRNIVGRRAHAAVPEAIRKGDEGLVLRSCRGKRPRSAPGD